MNQDRCLIMFAKYPEKGKVKSRLGLHWDEDIVAGLYRLFIEDLLDRLSGGDYQFRIAYHPVEKKNILHRTVRRWFLIHAPGRRRPG